MWAAIGELRRRGTWARMIWEVERSRALSFIIGFFCIVTGGVIMLVNPYDGLDLQSILVTILGGFILLEGVFFLAFPDWIVRASKYIVTAKSSIWAWFAVLIGLALMIIGYVRIVAS